MDRPIPPPHGFTLGAEPTRDESSSADLTARVEELQTQLETLALETEDAMRRARTALDRVRQADTQIANLERLLSAAHQREQELNIQLLSEQMKSAALAIQPDLAAPSTEGIEASLEAAERRADDAVRRADLLHGELLAATSERDRLQHRAAELGMHLSSALCEASYAASERARADRVQAERDAARAQAEAERRLTVASQTRATRAEARLAFLESPMLVADRRLAEATKRLRGVLQRNGVDEPDRVVDISDHATLHIDPKSSDERG